MIVGITRNSPVLCLAQNGRIGLVAKLIIFLAPVVFYGVTCGARQSTPDLSDALSGVKNGNLRTREVGFRKLMNQLSADGQNQLHPLPPSAVLTGFLARHPDKADELTRSLTNLLISENQTFMDPRVAPGTYSEDDMEYYARLIDVVSSLTDKRAIPALIGALPTGAIAQKGLLRYGDVALTPVLQELNSADARMRSAALATALAILSEKKDSPSGTQAKNILRLGLRDSDSSVRMEAVMLIDCSGSRQDFTVLLREIATTDPARFAGREDDDIDGSWYYPVRVQARRVLRNIEGNKTCRP